MKLPPAPPPPFPGPPFPVPASGGFPPLPGPVPKVGVPELAKVMLWEPWLRVVMPLAWVSA